MTDLVAKHFTEIIGLLGTLLGVFLGAFLNRISKFGQIKLYLNNVSYSFLEQNNSGGFQNTKKISEQTKFLSINLDFDLINTSEYSKKILRDIEFVATDLKSHHVIKINDPKNINILPKEIRNINLRVQFEKDFDKVLKSNWHLEYKTQNNKSRKFRIKKSKDLIVNT